MRSAHDALRFPPLLLGLAWALLGNVAAAGNAVHRCVDEGHVTYSDRDCGEQSEVVAIATISPVSLGAREPPVSAVQALPVALGMSPRMVFDTMGRPFATVATLEGRALVEYWVYHGAEGTTRVAFQEGRVTRVNTR